MSKKTVGILIISFITFFTLNVGAVPANPNPVTIVQPDGTLVTYYIKGDEKVHWMQSPDGYTLLRNSEHFVVYAETDSNGNLFPSNHIYTDNPLRSAALNGFLTTIPKNLRYSEEQFRTMTQIWEMTERAAVEPLPPVLGSKRALCVLASFSDKPITKSLSEFEALMNQAGYSSDGATGSVKDFYRENSYGQMDLTVTVIGPVVLPQTVEYYAYNDDRSREFAKAVAEAANVDIDFRDFANENGILETFHIIFAGYGDESVHNGKQIWSHKWALKSPVYLDGVKVWVYSCSPELRGSSGSAITTVGVICHELCHVFGAADYYDIDEKDSGGEYLGTGRWDLMAQGNWNGNSLQRDGSRPAHINMFQKILFGWVQPVELTEPQTIINMPNSAENPVAYTLKPTTNNEMYVLENRQKVGFDQALPGTGLLIYHIHNDAASGNIDNTGHPQQAYVVYASAASKDSIPNKTVSTYGSINSSGAPFTNQAGRNEFSGESSPRMFYWSGSAGVEVTDKALTEISQSDGLVSFLFRGGDSPYAVRMATPAATPVVVRPNPVKDVLTVSAADPVRLQVTDLNGRTVYSGTAAAEQTIDVSQWDKGVYLVRVQTKDGTHTEKMLKK
jgi:M6 family metalloprotease-like protein